MLASLTQGTIITVDHGILVTAPAAIDVITAATNLAKGRGYEVVDVALCSCSNELDCGRLVMAITSPAEMPALRSSLGMQKYDDIDRKATFSARAAAWRRCEHVGMSSRYLLDLFESTIHGTRMAGEPAAPSDEADIERCRKLVALIPEVKSVFSGLGSNWSAALKALS